MLSVPFTFPGAVVQLSTLALPAATTTVICIQRGFIYLGRGSQLPQPLMQLLCPHGGRDTAFWYIQARAPKLTEH